MIDETVVKEAAKQFDELERLNPSVVSDLLRLDETSGKDWAIRQAKATKWTEEETRGQAIGPFYATGLFIGFQMGVLAARVEKKLQTENA